MMTPKKTMFVASVLIGVFLAGMVAASVLLPPRYVYIAVEEAITIEPEAVQIVLFVGESKTADFTVHNGASVTIPLDIVAEVTACPEGGTASDVMLNYPTTLSAPTGDTTLTLTVTLATGAVIGDYKITLSVTRV